MLPPLDEVVVPGAMLIFPVCALAVTLPPLLLTFEFWFTLSPAVRTIVAVAPMLLTGPPRVRSSPAAGDCPAVSTMFPLDEMPAAPMTMGLCATRETPPPVAVTRPEVLRAPVLSTEMLPPLLEIPAISSTPALTSTMPPLPLLVALNVLILLPGFPRFVPVSEAVTSDVPTMGALWPIEPEGAVSDRNGAVIAPTTRFPEA